MENKYFSNQIKVVTKFTHVYNLGPSSTDYGMTLMGILIMQDVLLGVLMALLPNMADTGIEKETNYDFYIMIGFRLICGEIICWQCLIVIISRMKKIKPDT